MTAEPKWTDWQGEQPKPGFDAPRPEHAKRLPIAGIITGLAVALLAKVIAPMLPLINGHSLNEAHGYCSGVLGMLVRSFGGAQGDRVCNDVGNWVLASNLVGVAGLLFAACCGWVLYRRFRSARP